MATDWLKIAGYSQAPQRNAFTAGVSSGIDDLQGLMYSAGGAVADSVGADGVRDWMNDQADRNQWESQKNGRRDLENIENVYGSPSKWLPYAAYQVGKQVPNIAGAVVAGLAVPEVAVPAVLSRAAAFGPQRLGMGGMSGRLAAAEGYTAKKAAVEAAEASGKSFADQVVGGGAFNYVQGVGSLYQESVDAGNPNAGPRSLLEGVPYAAAETMPEAMMLGRIKHGSGFKGGMAARMGKSAVSQAATGATSELLQGEMEMGMHPDGQLSDEDIFSRRLNSGVAGGLVEGLLGSLGGVRGHHTPKSLLTGQDVVPAMQDVNTPDTSVTGELTPEQQQAAQLAAQQKQQRDAEQAARAAQIEAAKNLYLEKQNAVSNLLFSPEELQSNPALSNRAVNAFHELSSLGDAAPNAAELIGAFRVAYDAKDKNSVNEVLASIEKQVADTKRKQEKAAKDAQKAQEKTDKEAQKKQEDLAKTSAAVAENNANAQAAAPVQPTVTPNPTIQANTTEEAANALLADPATQANQGGQGSSQAAGTNTATTGKPGQTASNAGGVQPAPVDNSALVPPSVKPIPLGPQGGKGADAPITVKFMGKTATVKALHWNRVRAALGLDDDGFMRGDHKSIQEVADAAGVTRTTIYKSFEVLGFNKKLVDEILAGRGEAELQSIVTGEDGSHFDGTATEQNEDAGKTVALSDERDSSATGAIAEGTDEGSGATGYRVANSLADAAKGDHLLGDDRYKEGATHSKAAAEAKRQADLLEAKARRKERLEARKKVTPEQAAELAKAEKEHEAKNAAIAAENERLMQLEAAERANDKASQRLEADAREEWNSNLDDHEAEQLSWENLPAEVRSRYLELYQAADSGEIKGREYHERTDELYDTARQSGGNRAGSTSVRPDGNSKTDPIGSVRGADAQGQGGSNESVRGDQATAAGGESTADTQGKPRFQRAPKPGQVTDVAPKEQVKPTAAPIEPGQPIPVEITVNGQSVKFKDAEAQIAKFQSAIKRLEAFAACVRG